MFLNYTIKPLKIYDTATDTVFVNVTSFSIRILKVGAYVCARARAYVVLKTFILQD